MWSFRELDGTTRAASVDVRARVIVIPCAEEFQRGTRGTGIPRNAGTTCACEVLQVDHARFLACTHWIQRGG